MNNEKYLNISELGMVTGGSPIDFYVDGGENAVRMVKIAGELTGTAVWEVRVAFQDLAEASSIYFSKFGAEALGGLAGLAGVMFSGCVEIAKGKYREAPDFIGTAFKLTGRVLDGVGTAGGDFIFKMTLKPK